MAQESKAISFADFVEVRKEEMQSMLPGLMTVLTNPYNGHTTVIYSKAATVAAPKAPTVKKKNKQ